MNEENNNGNDANASENEQHEPVGLKPALVYIFTNKVKTVLFLTRIGTIFFSLISFTSLLGYSMYSSYQRALLCNAATSALRLHQRIPRVQFSMAFGAMLIMEDSCHYLLYSLLFLYSYPMQFALVPIFLFAVLHAFSHLLVILYKMGIGETYLYQFLSDMVKTNQRGVLTFIALSEVILFPFTVGLMFFKGSILTPFAYYRFLTFRYSSRRNPYTRNVFHELRLQLERIAEEPSYPQLVRSLSVKLITTVSWMAPLVATPH